MAARPNPRTAPNRFAGGGVAVLGEDFTNRELERAEIARSLRTPKGHIVVGGPRRIGKTSILLAVRDELLKAGHPVLYVDLWTASTLEDMTTRLAREATAALGRSWTEIMTRLGQRLKFGFEVSETASGMMVPVPKLEFRDAPLAAQRQRLVEALDLLEELAAKHRTHLGVILDEFQEIERLGSDEHRNREGGSGKGRGGSKHVSAMRQVRAAIQRHRHVTYAFAGSDRQLIERLHEERGGALHNLGRRYEIGPIEPQHFAGWIQKEFAAMGIDAAGLALRIIQVSGPRTRDVRTLAETVAELARTKPRVTETMIADGMMSVVRQRRPSYEAGWKPLTSLQQNVLRAAAVEGEGLARHGIRMRYGLGEASRVTKTVDTLAERAILLRDGGRILFDDPFFRAWIVISVLPDVGVDLPITYVPGAAPFAV